MRLDSLFETQVSYRIPQFQRPYAWGEEQWSLLWSDVRKIADRILDGQANDDLLPHFMGAIVLQDRKTPFDEVNQVLVVDGQQRLTTLQLLIKAMQNAFATSLSDVSKFDELEKFLWNDDSRTGNDPRNATKIRQSNALDQEEFQDVIRDSINENRPHRSMAKAYAYFQKEVYDWINKDTANLSVRANALFRTLTEYLKVATIILDSGEKPHFIFEVLNTRGEPLKQADHIKNTVMYEADVVDDERKARQLWSMFEDDWWRREDGRGRDPQIYLDRFLNYWTIMRISENVTMRQVAAEFRAYIEKEKRPIDDIARDIREAGRIYRNIVKNQQPGIEPFLERIKTMEIGVIMPPLLWLYTQEINEEERQKSIRALESYLVRRMLCNLGSQGLNRLFIEMMKSLESNKEQRADKTVIEFLKGQDVENRMWPDDNRVMNSLTSRPMPGNAARRKMVFEAIETSIASTLSEPLGSTKELTVEHILPQRWKEGNWPLSSDIEDKTDAEKARNEFVNLIGNLTLSTKELNSTMSNRSWEDKKERLHNHSRLFLNKNLLDNHPDVWDEAAIEKRSQEMAQKAIDIWPHADGI